jgi:hypothetical protein
VNGKVRVRVKKAYWRISGWRMGQATFLVIVLGLMNIEAVRAITEPVSLERLGVKDVILLPTISSQYVTQFTLPKTWKVSGKTAVEVSFQHAMQLLPERSWLQVILNDHVIKHVALTHENVNNTKMLVPLPVALLQDNNTLAFRVQQHYTNHCEDPLDKSLWTQILPATRLLFDYQLTAPKVDLAQYPYPIIDPLTYSPARVHYVVAPDSPTPVLEALALVNAHLAQEAGGKHEMFTRLTARDAANADDEHLLYIGTAEQLAALQGWHAALGGDLILQGGRWKTRSTGQDLADDQGVLLFRQAGGSLKHTVLVVSGNSEKGVLQAARYLSSRPRGESLKGVAIAMSGGWNPIDARSIKVPRYLETESRSFQELEFPTEEVHKINAPPIVYKIPIVSDFSHSRDGKLWLDLSYSYGPGLNPTFSSLELRMNDKSIGNIPLLNPEGENSAHASLPISNELIHPRNELVAQFHMEPDKKGWCVDNYVDKAWGKILDNSRFRIEGRPNTLLPDTELLGAAMFPYSRADNLESVKILLPENPDAPLLEAMLAWTTRLGRNTLADTDLRLNLAKAGGVESGQNGVAFVHAGESLSLPEGAKLIWSGERRRLSIGDPAGGSIDGDLGGGGGSAYLEQFALGADRVISVWTAPANQDFRMMTHWLESDKAFEAWQEALEKGVLNQVSPIAGEEVLNINTARAIRYHQEGNATDGGLLGMIIGWLGGMWGNLTSLLAGTWTQIRHWFGLTAG